MRITVSGLAGSGTTTIARRLADAFDYTHINAGAEFRRYAARHGFSVDELNAYAENSIEFDHEFDRWLQASVADESDLVFESRYTGRRLADVSVRIWLYAPFDVRARRIARREGISFDAAAERVGGREESVRTRAKNHYDIDIDDTSVYDVELCTADWTVPETVEYLVAEIRSKAAGRMSHFVRQPRNFPQIPPETQPADVPPPR